MKKKELSRKLRTYAYLKTRAFKDFKEKMNRADEMAEWLNFINYRDFEDLDKQIELLGEAQAEKRFTINLRSEKLEEKIDQLVQKYAESSKEVENE